MSPPQSIFAATLRAAVLGTFAVSTIAGCAGGTDQERTSAQDAPAAQSSAGAQQEPVGYDSLLAAELGADDYGMRRYVMALLKAGPNRSQDSTRAAELQQAHMANIRRLAEEGKLILAGPFLGSGPLRGIYVFDVTTVEEARELTMTDPAIQAGRLEMELLPWYGSAALMKVNEISTRISREEP